MGDIMQVRQGFVIKQKDSDIFLAESDGVYGSEPNLVFDFNKAKFYRVSEDSAKQWSASIFKNYNSLKDAEFRLHKVTIEYTICDV